MIHQNKFTFKTSSSFQCFLRNLFEMHRVTNSYFSFDRVSGTFLIKIIKYKTFFLVRKEQKREVLSRFFKEQCKYFWTSPISIFSTFTYICERYIRVRSPPSHGRQDLQKNPLNALRMNEPVKTRKFFSIYAFLLGFFNSFC